MTIEQTQTNADLRSKAEAGNLPAADELATLLYGQGQFEDSATLYLKAFEGGFYSGNSKPESEQNFFRMIDGGLISMDSAAARFVRERRRVSQEVTGRAHKAAGRAGIATFIGYMALIFGGGVSGFLRDFSLVIAGGLAWAAWQMVLSSFSE